MKQTINESQFRDEFARMGRKDSFSYDGLSALYNYFEEYEESGGEEIELDVIAICGEYTEYENLKELQDNYSGIENMDDLENNTTVIKIDDEGFIIQDY